MAGEREAREASIMPIKIGLNRSEAAALCKLTPACFDAKVADGRLPKPIDIYGELVWDRRNLEPAEPVPVPGIIYFAGFEGYVKIGFTRDVASRVAQLQIAAPVTINVYHTFAGFVMHEKEMHEWFSAYRLRGEWFRFIGYLKQWVEDERRRR